jgi:hypothetical protein
MGRTSYGMNARLTTGPPGGLSGPYNSLSRPIFMNQIYASHEKQDILFHQLLANTSYAKRIVAYKPINYSYLRAKYGRFQ